MTNELFDFTQILKKRKASNYYPRIADSILLDKLNTFGAVCIVGPKWCGKTRTAEQFASSALYLQDPSIMKSIMMFGDTNPNRLLDGAKPRLLDEWQIVPKLWDAVRFAIDTENDSNQYILTGSTVVDMSKIMHSGAGRIARMTMRPMSLFESAESSGCISLSSLFQNPNQDILGVSYLDIEQLACATVRGGWPFAVLKSKSTKFRVAKEYIDTIVNSEIFSITNLNIKKDKFLTLLKSLARNVSTQASVTTLSKDSQLISSSWAAIDTTNTYLDILNKLCITEDLTAWSPHIRSKTAIRTALTRHFTDPSIPTALLDLSEKSLLTDFETFGLIFEDLCIRDLRVYVDSIGGNVYHYRDKNNLEIDAIIHLNNGNWAGIEIKMGSTEIDKAAINLKRLRDTIDNSKMQAPSFLMVLTATNTAYRRPDGVYVVPIGCLKN